MTLAEEAKEYWHAIFEARRISDDSFDHEMTLALAFALMVTATAPIDGFGVRELLQCLRSWYSPYVARTSVLNLMRHYSGLEPEVVTRIGQALWDTHRDQCNDAAECALHSIGQLWGYDWIKPTPSDREWFVPAILALLRQHPIRGWAMHLIYSCANSLRSGSLTHADIAAILTSAADARLLERIANPEMLSETWHTIVKDAPNDVCAELLAFGNRAVAHGCTNLIGPQLGLLQRMSRRKL